MCQRKMRESFHCRRCHRLHPLPSVLYLIACIYFVFPSPTHAQTNIGSEQITDSQGHFLIKIPPQRFEQGAREPDAFDIDHAGYNSNRDDTPIHPVILTRPFLIASHEVTRAQFAKFVRETDYSTTAEKEQTGIVGWQPLDHPEGTEILQSFQSLPKFSWRNPGFEQTDFHPVVGVSFQDALAYCEWLTEKEGRKYRLPTEAEWECVARAGTKTYFSFGNDYQGLVHRHANLANTELENAFRDRTMIQWFVDPLSNDGDQFVFTSPVGSLAPNPWSMHDMHGNVWEWCEDRYLDTYYDRFHRPAHRAVRPRAIDPVCDEKWNENGEWRVIRGGSWCNSPIQARSAVRSYFDANDAACYLGFRVVREADESSIRLARERFLASNAALDDLQSLSDTLYEESDGHLELRFRCEDLTAQRLSPLKELDDSVRVAIAPPGKLTEELIESVSLARNLNGVIFRTGGNEIHGGSFGSLATHPELERIQITGMPELGNEVVTTLRNAKGIVSLHLQGSGINDTGLGQLKSSRTLALARMSATASAGHFLSRFEGSPLKTVSFSQLDDRGAQILSGFPSLRDVNIDTSPVSDIGLQSLTKLRRLQILSLKGCDQLTDKGLAQLASLTFLERLDLQGTRASQLTYTALPRLNRLRHLRVPGRGFTTNSYLAIASLTGLQTLSIASIPSATPTHAFKPFKRLVNLKTLELSADEFSPTNVRDVCEMPSLRVLELSSPTISNSDLAALSKHATLERLTIGNRDQDPSHQFDAIGLMDLCQSESLQQVTLIGYRDLIPANVLESLASENKNIAWRSR